MPDEPQHANQGKITKALLEVLNIPTLEIKDELWGRDADDAVVMSLDQFNSLMETVHLLKSPANASHLAKSIKQYQSGKTARHGLVDD